MNKKQEADKAWTLKSSSSEYLTGVEDFKASLKKDVKYIYDSISRKQAQEMNYYGGLSDAWEDVLEIIDTCKPIDK